MSFDTTLRSVLASCIRSKAFCQDVATWGANPKDFPTSIYATALSDMLTDIKSNSVEYAQWKLSKSLIADMTVDDMKIPPLIVRTEFFNNLETARAERLAMDILKDPAHISELIKNYTARIAPKDDLFNLADVVEKIDWERKEKAAAGQMIKNIQSWPKLSDHIGGFNAGRIGICMAESGFGKTNFALNLALCAQRTMKVIYVNMEMVLEDICERVFAATSGKSFADIRKGVDVHSDKLSLELKSGGQILMTSGRDKSLLEIEAILRAQKDPPNFVVIDYDQKLILETSYQTPEWRALQFAMARFEELAKELGCYILILAQTNLDGEISGSHRSRFSASSIWSFEDDTDHGPILRFPKNRFGPKNKILKVIYEPHCARIFEGEMETVVKRQKKKL